MVFWTKFAKKDISRQKQKKWTSSLNLHIQISLGIKFQLKLTILNFLTRFTQKGFLWFRTEKVNTTYFLHNSAYSHYSSAKFQLKLTILIFWTKFVQKGISSRKQKKWKTPWNSVYLNWSRYKISASTDNFEFVDQI